MAGDTNQALLEFRETLWKTPNPKFSNDFITAMKETGFVGISSMKPITCKDGAVDLLIK